MDNNILMSDDEIDCENSQLYLAAKSRQKEAVKHLIDTGEDIHCSLSEDKYTVLHYAAENGWFDIVYTLLRKGVDIEAVTKHGDTPVLLAAHHQHGDIVEMLVAVGAKVNRRYQNNYTVLHYASENGWLNVVKSLLDSDANIRVKTASGNSPLLLAAHNQHKDIVELLIDAGANVNYFHCQNKYTVLHYASKNGWSEIVRSLLEKGADFQVSTACGITPLLLATEKGHKDIVELLVDYGADVTFTESQDNYTALHYASKNGSFEIVQLLVEKGADIQAKTKHNESPLLLAADYRHIDVVKLLIGAGADVDCAESQNNYYTTLHYAAENGWSEVVQSLLEKGADVQVKTKYDESALLLAAKNQHRDIVELLVNAGADTNYADWCNYTVLHYAAENGWIELVQSLLDKGVDIHMKTKHCESPLQLAAHRKHENIVELLITAGADINCSDWCNYTVLHYAVRNGWLKVAKFLLEKGADIQQKTKYGESPLLLAAECKHKDIVEFLVDSGADVTCSENQKNYTALHHAARMGLLEIVKFLVQRGADIQAKSKHGESPMHMAAEFRHKDIFDLLYEAGTDIAGSGGLNHYTLLHYASKNGWLDTVQSLLTRGADIEAKTKLNDTPLLLASKSRHKNIVEILMDAGADIHCSGGSEKGTVLHYTARKGWLDIVESLLKKGANIEARLVSGETPIVLAVEYERRDIVECLINAGADVNTKTNTGNTLMFNLLRTSPDFGLVRLLVESGAYFSSIDYNLLVSDSALKEHVLGNVNICYHALLNEFNNKDLPQLYKLSGACLPDIENMKIGKTSQVAREVLETVTQEIAMKGYCNLLEVNPIVLKKLSVQSLISYFDHIKNGISVSHEGKRSADDDHYQHTAHSSKMMRLN